MPTQEEIIRSLEQKVENLTQLVIDSLKITDDCPPGIQGPRGKDGVDGKNGKDGVNGKTPVKGIDYFDGSDGFNGLNGRNGNDGKDGVDGQAQGVLTSYVFFLATDQTVPQKPIGGSYNNPLPSSSGWTDGLPSGQGAVYMSHRIFTDNQGLPQQAEWSEPLLASDSTVIEFAWSSISENPGTPITDPDNWVLNQVSEDNIWMAIRTLDSGQWSDWRVIKIKGEDGSPGDSFEVRYSKNGSFTVPPELNISQRNPSGWSLVPPTLAVGEYCWMIQAVISKVTNELVGFWSNAIRISGERGPQGNDGLQGPSSIFRGDWKETTQYQGSNLGIDLVKYTVNGKGYLSRVDAGQIPIGTLPTDTQYWNEATLNIDALFTDFLFAYSAYIEDLTVGSLQTGIEGTRLEVLKDNNRLFFYQDNNVDPSLEIGLIELPRQDSIIVLDPPPYITGGLKIGDTKLSGDGIYIISPRGSVFRQTTIGTNIQYKFNHVATAIIYNTDPKVNPVGEGNDRNNYGVVTNSLYLDKVGYGGGGNAHSEGIFVGYDIVNKKPYRGFTGDINGAKFVDGICVGPA